MMEISIKIWKLVKYKVYSKLKDNKIYYNDGKNTNLLNGAIITSRKDKGKVILVPDIKLKRYTKIYEQKQTIFKQKNIIKEKNSIIEKLEEKVNEIPETFNNFIEKMFNFCDKICRALGHKIRIHFFNIEINYNDMEYYTKSINHKSEKDKSDDFEIEL